MRPRHEPRNNREQPLKSQGASSVSDQMIIDSFNECTSSRKAIKNYRIE